MTKDEKAAFEELVDEFEKYKRDMDTLVEKLVERIQKLEDTVETLSA